MRRTVAALVACVLLVVVPAALPATAQTDDPPAEAPLTPTLAIDMPDGWVRPGDDLIVTVRATSVPDGAAVRASLLEPLTDATKIVTAPDDRIVHRYPTEAVAAIDGAGEWELRLPTVDLDDKQLFADASLHRLRVDLVEGDAVVASQSAAFTPDVGAAWPVAVVVDLSADGTIDARSNRPLVEVGRLAGLVDLLALFPDLPIAIHTTGDTLAALVADDRPVAGSLLARLRRSVEGRELLATPMSDVSPDSLDRSSLAGLIVALLDLGAAQAADTIGLIASPTVWAADADLGSAGASVLAGAGIDTIVIAAGALDPSPDDAGPFVLRGGGGAAALASDPALVTALTAGDLSGDGAEADPTADTDDDSSALTDATATEVRLSVLASELARRRGAAVLWLDRFDPDDRVAAAVLARVASATGIATPTAVADLPSPDPDDVASLRGTGPGPLGVDVGRLDGLATRFESFDVLVGAQSPAAIAARTHVAAAVARGRSVEDRNASLDVVDEVIDRTFAGITLGGAAAINLSSRTGTLPVTIRNETGAAVRVTIRVRSDRLRFPNGSEITVRVDESRRIDIDVESLATGSVPTFVEIVTPDGAVVLDERQLNVRSTAISGVGFVLIAGALAVLAIWWIRSHRRRTASDQQHDRGQPAS